MSKTTTPCCSKVGIKKGPWTPEEDEILANFVRKEGEGRWRTLPKRAGLLRCGKSCRLRWMNYLRPSVKRGRIALDEEDLILRLHRLLGNRWALIAGRIPGRTDNEIKNYWNTQISKKLIRQGIDPRTHKPLLNNNTNHTNTNTKTTTTTITTPNGLLSDSQKVEHHDHESNVASSNPIIIPTPQPAVMGLISPPALETGSSSSTQTSFEVPVTAGKLMEYQNKAGHVVDGNDSGTNWVNDEEDTFLLFLNSLVDDDNKVMSTAQAQTLQAADTMFPPPLCPSTSFAQPFGLADWEAEFNNVLNGQYGSPSM